MLASVATLILLVQTPAAVTPKPADVSSPDAIVKALYDVISGPAGQKRDWDRFRSLFSPKGSLTALAKNRAGGIVVIAMTPEDYITRSGAMIEKDGFFEKEIDRKTETRGNIMHVWSQYEARIKPDDAKPLMAGTNAIQLFTDGKRWFIHSVVWE